MNDKLPPVEDDDVYSMKFTDNDYLPIALLFIGAAVFAIVLRLAYGANAVNSKDYWALSGSIGSFISGVAGPLFSLAAFIYLYLSFKKQRQATETQLEIFNHDKIENRFFELVKIHRDNVKEMSFTFFFEKYKYLNGKPEVTKEQKTIFHRHVFYAIVKQFEEAESELRFLFDSSNTNSIYEVPYLEELQKNRTLKERQINLFLYAKIDLIYLIVFFGVTKEGKNTIKKITKDKYKETFVSLLLNLAALKPKIESNYWEKWLLLISQENREDHMLKISEQQNDQKIADNQSPYYYSLRYEKYYGGHQFRLGHYFRHLFQSVSFINDQKNLKAEDQYNYVRHLRGQLSNYEQILFFFNSLSQLGRVWELESSKSGVVTRHLQLVTDYQLIKNIPNDRVCLDIKFSDFYPEVKFTDS